MVIRPMTEEEIAFLDKFYEEYIVTTLSKDDDNELVHEDNILSEGREERAKKYEALKAEREYVKKKLDKLDPIKDMAERNVLARKYVDLKDEIRRHKPYDKETYDRNNDRNNDLYNKLKMINDLELKTWGEWDQNNIFEREYHDMELMNAYYAGIVEATEEDEED